MRSLHLVFLVGLALFVEHAAAGCFQWPTVTNIDSKATVTIRKKLDGMPVTRFCPGVDYIVKVQFPEPRSLKLAAAWGIVSGNTGNCANMTSKAVEQVTWELPLSMPCDIIGDMLTLKIASKVAMAEAFFCKNITFPLNQLTACPKSRCNLVTGVSNTTVTSLLSGVPLFDLFTKLGVKMGLGANQLLTFDVTKLNKTMTPEAFMQVLMSISQFKTLGAKTMLDPTMVLSLLNKFSGLVPANNTDATTVLFYQQSVKLLSLWGPTFWGSTTTTGLSSSSYIDLASKMITAGTGGTAGAFDFTAAQNAMQQYVQANSAADAMLNIMSAMGSILSDADGVPSSTSSVSASSFVSAVTAMTSMFGVIGGAGV